MQHSDDIQAALHKAARIIQKLERRVAELDGRSSEPIAIVGVGCRLPGGIVDLGTLWQVLKGGADVMGPAPAGRLGPDAALGSGSRALAGPHAGWLDAVDQFDADFFGISPREAAWIDPQQRLLLECAWEALERPGITRQRMRQGTTGVYVGLGSHDYAHGLVRHAASELEPYLATGTSASFAAGRVAYGLGLQGPALTLDTSCSSSLVALHLACRALRADECDLALVGGVQLMLAELPFVLLSRLRALAPDGRCKTFSERADGYGRSEGCVVLAVERLSTALRLGDPILGLVRGSAINHDGDKSGITTPNGNAQRAVILRALSDARLDAADVDYVEAHGTGTALGDPIELAALAAVYAPGRTQPLRLGSLKSHLGHLEAAAGLAGVLAVLAAFEGQALPPNLHTEPLTRRFDWETNPLKVVTELERWCRCARVRRAGVSSFGMSGTNAHVVLEEGPLAADTRRSRPRPAELVMLSAKNPSALAALTTRLHEQLQARPELELADVAHSLASTRTLFGERWVVCVATRAELERALAAASAGAAASDPAPARARAPQLPPQLTWFLPDVGAERLGMGRELYQEWPVFRAALDAAFQALDPHLERPLRSLMWGEPSPATHAEPLEHAESALFALGWALAALWRSWGVEPDRVVADGSGELTAACIAGVMSLSDGASCVVQYAAARRAALAGASPPAAWSRALARAELRPPTLAWISTRAGDAEPDRIATTSYWTERASKPVQLEQAARALAAAGAGAGLELAAVESLGPRLAAHLPPQLLYRLPACEPGVAEYRASLNALGHWIAQGGSVNEAGLSPDARQRVALPTYPWQRQRHWIDAPPRTSPAVAERAAGERKSGELAAAGAAAIHPHDVRDLVNAEVARVLGLSAEALPVSVPLGELGLDSVMALELESALCRGLDVALSPSLRLESISARALADTLLTDTRLTTPGLARVPGAASVDRDDDLPAATRPWTTVGAGTKVAHGLLLERLPAPRARLFCFPGAGGSAGMFRPFVSLADAGLEVHVIAHRRTTRAGGEAAGIGERYLDEAAAYVRAFSGAPTVLMGHSLGALFAWRVATHLMESGHPGPALFVPSAMGPHGMVSGALSLAEVLAPVLGEGTALGAELGSVNLDFAADLALYSALPEPSRMPLVCPIAACAGRDDRLVSARSMHAWQTLTRSDFSLAILPGDHFYLHQPDPLRRFLQELRERVARRLPRPAASDNHLDSSAEA